MLERECFRDKERHSKLNTKNQSKRSKLRSERSTTQETEQLKKHYDYYSRTRTKCSGTTLCKQYKKKKIGDKYYYTISIIYSKKDNDYLKRLVEGKNCKN
jgi:hypothetical protein